MQKPETLPLIGLAAVAASLAAAYLSPRITVPASRILPVEGFPRRISGWTAGQDDVVDDPVVRAVLPTARMVERNYANASGKSVNLLLLTASRREDFHDPNLCFPGDGWHLSDPRSARIDGQTVNVMTAERDGVKVDVWYWWMGLLDFEKSKTDAQTNLLLFRRRILDVLGRHDGMSLFVRMVAPRTVAGEQDMRAFSTAALPRIRPVDTGKRENGRVGLPQVVRLLLTNSSTFRGVKTFIQTAPGGE